MKDALDPNDARSQAHARRMDRKYAVDRFLYNTTRPFFLLGRNAAIQALDLTPASTLLEIGCGTGRNIALILKAQPNLSIDAIDISEKMLALAVRRVGRQPGVRLVRADAETFEPGRIFACIGYDRVLMSYSLSMVPDWPAALRRALAAVAPGGRLVIADFGSFAGFGRYAGLAKRSLARHQAPPCEGLPQAVEECALGIGPFTVEAKDTHRGFTQVIVAERRAAP